MRCNAKNTGILLTCGLTMFASTGLGWAFKAACMVCLLLKSFLAEAVARARWKSQCRVHMKQIGSWRHIYSKFHVALFQFCDSLHGPQEKAFVFWRFAVTLVVTFTCVLCAFLRLEVALRPIFKFAHSFVYRWLRRLLVRARRQRSCLIINVTHQSFGVGTTVTVPSPGARKFFLFGRRGCWRPSGLCWIALSCRLVSTIPYWKCRARADTLEDRAFSTFVLVLVYFWVCPCILRWGAPSLFLNAWWVMLLVRELFWAFCSS